MDTNVESTVESGKSAGGRRGSASNWIATAAAVLSIAALLVSLGWSTGKSAVDSQNSGRSAQEALEQVRKLEREIDQESRRLELLISKTAEDGKELADRKFRDAQQAADMLRRECSDASKHLGTKVGILEDRASQRSADLLDNSLLTTPLGAIVAWPGASAPHGWAICDGSTVEVPNRESRMALVKVLDAFRVSQAGVPAGGVRLPDLRGQFLRGYDPTGSVDVESRALGSAQADAFQKHDHEIVVGRSGGHSHDIAVDVAGEHTHTASSAPAGRHSHTLTTSVAVYSTGGDTDGDPNGSRDGGKIKTDESADHTHAITVQPGGKHSHTARTSSPGEHSHAASCSKSGSSDETRPKNVAVNWIMRIQAESSLQ